jgi:Flp pilus assembly protein CpaB
VRNKKLLILAVLLGAAAVFLVNSKFSALEAQAKPPTTTLYLAAVDIAPGITFQQALEDQQFLRPVDTVPAAFSNLYRDAVTVDAYESFKDSKISRPVKAREFLRWKDLETFTPTELGRRFPSAGGSEGRAAANAAVSISVTAESSVSYLVAPGDRVDVYVTRMVEDAASPGGRKAQARIAVPNVYVLAVDAVVVEDEANRRAAPARGTPYRTVTLAGTEAEVRTLLEAQSEGVLSLALRKQER